MAKLLGWDDETKQREIARYQDEVALSRRWRDGLPERASTSPTVNA